eukprot:2717013-Pleurochrysis_carterae.AAC.1
MLPEPVLDDKPGVYDPEALHREEIFFADVFTWATKYRLAHAEPMPAPEAVPEWEAEPEMWLRFKKIGCCRGFLAQAPTVTSTSRRTRSRITRSTVPVSTDGTECYVGFASAAAGSDVGASTVDAIERWHYCLGTTHWPVNEAAGLIERAEVFCALSGFSVVAAVPRMHSSRFPLTGDASAEKALTYVCARGGPSAFKGLRASQTCIHISFGGASDCQLRVLEGAWMEGQRISIGSEQAVCAAREFESLLEKLGSSWKQQKC